MTTYHSLLPIQFQNILKHAAETKRADVIDVAINDCYAMAPDHFHNVDSLSTRIFHDQPTRPLPMAGFVNPAPRRT